MINVLEFDMSTEYKLSWNVAARACYSIFYNLPECMLLYRHEIAEPYIWTKFGTNHPDKIDLQKLDGKNLFLFHLDVYKEETEKLKDLIKHCFENSIEVWIVYPTKNVWRSEEPHLKIVKDILDSYQPRYYDLTNIEHSNENEISASINNKIKPILRDIKLKRLID